MTAHKPLIEVRNMTKSYKLQGGETIEVLHNVNFDIDDGSFTIIYGPSGSGKSTLLNAIIGLDAPTYGSVTYDGEDLYTMSSNERAQFRASTMGMVQQTNNWVKSLTVQENVALPLHFTGIDHAAAMKEALSVLRHIGMDVHAKKYPSILSGGEQQRVAMARALVNNPAYIVADEPTGNLDSKNSDDLINLLRTLNKEYESTIVLVTHNLEYLSIGDKLLLMQDGRVTEIHGKDIQTTTTHMLSDMRKRIEGWTKV
jgi:putative ABC transport system ATP-binding protein